MIRLPPSLMTNTIALAHRRENKTLLGPRNKSGRIPHSIWTNRLSLWTRRCCQAKYKASLRNPSDAAQPTSSPVTWDQIKSRSCSKRTFGHQALAPVSTSRYIRFLKFRRGKYTSARTRGRPDSLNRPRITISTSQALCSCSHGTHPLFGCPSL